MAEVKTDRKYTQDHEWVLSEADVLTVGITDFAQHELGDIVFVEFPEVGATIEKGKSFGSIEAVKTVAELFAPVNGTVSAVNEQIQNDSSLVNSDCYGQGWLIKIKPNNSAEISSLLDASAYEKLTAE